MMWYNDCIIEVAIMICFTTIPLKYEGVLDNNTFVVPESPATEDVLNSYVKLWSKVGIADGELELYNYVAALWPFIALTSREFSRHRPQLPLEFSLS
jgi:hypothetical protein